MTAAENRRRVALAQAAAIKTRGWGVNAASKLHGSAEDMLYMRRLREGKLGTSGRSAAPRNMLGRARVLA